MLPVSFGSLLFQQPVGHEPRHIALGSATGPQSPQRVSRRVDASTLSPPLFIPLPPALEKPLGVPQLAFKVLPVDSHATLSSGRKRQNGQRLIVASEASPLFGRACRGAFEQPQRSLDGQADAVDRNSGIALPKCLSTRP